MQKNNSLSKSTRIHKIVAFQNDLELTSFKIAKYTNEHTRNMANSQNNSTIKHQLICYYRYVTIKLMESMNE